jgi:hypothetical protein
MGNYTGPILCLFARAFIYILFARRFSEAAMGGAEVGGHHMINMTIRKLFFSVRGFFTKLEFSLISSGCNKAQ